MIDIFYVNNSFKNVTLGKHFHEEYTISLVYEGAHLFSTNKGTYNIKAGVIQTINPHELHMTENSTWSHMNIMPRVELIKEIASQLLQKELDYDIVINTVIEDEKAVELFTEMFNSFEDEDKNSILVDSNVISFLEYILRHHSSIKENEIIEANINDDELLKSLDYINENISDKELNLDSIASSTGFSKYHFLREFKKKFGLTPNQYIQIKRVSKVRELLKYNDSLSNIAFESGFTDQSYMIKVFKKYTGYTPSQINSA